MSSNNIMYAAFGLLIAIQIMLLLFLQQCHGFYDIISVNIGGIHMHGSLQLTTSTPPGREWVPVTMRVILYAIIIIACASRAHNYAIIGHPAHAFIYRRRG